jgi:hypothetical protein
MEGPELYRKYGEKMVVTIWNVMTSVIEQFTGTSETVDPAALCIFTF